MTSHGICLQQFWSLYFATNLDFHNKVIYTRDLTYLHNDLQMFRVYHDEALVSLKKNRWKWIKFRNLWKPRKWRKMWNCEHYARFWWVQNLKSICWLVKTEFLSLPFRSSKCQGFDEPYVIKIWLNFLRFNDTQPGWIKIFCFKGALKKG